VFSGKLTRDAVFGGGTPNQRSASGTVNGSSAVVPRNNPGNLRSWAGVPTVGGFAQFGTPQAGLQAMAQQLRLYGNRDGLNTVAGIVGKYAPPSENNTSAYIADVSRQTGFAPGQRLDVNDPRVLAPLLSAMVKHEQGRQPFTADQYAQAAGPLRVEVVIGGNAPPGTTVQAKQGNTFVPTRVSYSMPMTDSP
jgi:hypothetical protein